MTHVLLRRAALALALATVLAACGKDEAADPGAADQAPAATAAVPADEVPAPAPDANTTDESPLRLAELDAYARGMQQELALLKAAGDKVAQARAKGDKDAEANAMMEMATLDTAAEAAKAAGLPQPRYEFVKTAVEGALGKLEMQAAMQSAGTDADTSELTPEQRQQIEDGRAQMEASLGDPYQGMAADVAEAFKARQAELAPLRAQAIAARRNASRGDRLPRRRAAAAGVAAPLRAGDFVRRPAQPPGTGTDCMITFAIIALTVVVSWQAFERPQLLQRLILWPPAIDRQRQYDRLLTHGFIHADWSHLLFNMITLYFFGRLIERFMTDMRGPLVFPLFYLSAIVIAILPTYLRHRHDAKYSSLGASGAVSAVMFAFILLQPWSLIFIPVPVPAVLYAVGYVGYSFWKDRQGGGNINHSAHLSGAIYGVLFMLAMDQRIGPYFLKSLGSPSFG